MDKSPIVWVTQENPLLDYTDAERFGEVKFVTADELTTNKGSLRNVDIYKRVLSALSTFDPSKDFVLSSGAPNLVATVFYVIGMLHPKVDINFLAWNNRARQYRHIVIPAFTAIFEGDR